MTNLILISVSINNRSDKVDVLIEVEPPPFGEKKRGAPSGASLFSDPLWFKIKGLGAGIVQWIEHAPVGE